MPKSEHELSLLELAGQPVKDIYGYVSHEFGDACFKLTRIEFQDGRTSYVGGEHDFPYLEDYDGVVPLPEKVSEERG